MWLKSTNLFFIVCIFQVRGFCLQWWYKIRFTRGSKKLLHLLGHVHYILWLTSPPMCWNQVDKGKNQTIKFFFLLRHVLKFASKKHVQNATKVKNVCNFHFVFFFLSSDVNLQAHFLCFYFQQARKPLVGIRQL